MDWDDLADVGKILTYLVPAIIIILTNVVFRKQKQKKERISVVRSLLSETEYNQRLMEAFSLGWQTKKFKTGAWRRNKAKIDYIDPGLRYTLDAANAIADEFNREIDAAKKHKSMSYLAGIRVDRLKEPLAESKEGLEEWLRLNTGKEKLPASAR